MSGWRYRALGHPCSRPVASKQTAFDEFHLVDPQHPDKPATPIDLAGDLDDFWGAGTSLVVHDCCDRRGESVRLIDLANETILDEYRPSSSGRLALSPSGEWVAIGDRLINLSVGSTEHFDLRDRVLSLSVSDDGTVMQVPSDGQVVIVQHGTERLIDLPQHTSTTGRSNSGIG